MLAGAMVAPKAFATVFWVEPFLFLPILSLGTYKRSEGLGGKLGGASSQLRIDDKFSSC